MRRSSILILFLEALTGVKGRRAGIVIIALALGLGLGVVCSTKSPVRGSEAAQPADDGRRGLVDRVAGLEAFAPPVGAVIAYAGKWSEEREIQTGWMLCDGRALDAAKYLELADALGQSEGKVQLPNLGGRTIVGVGKGTVKDAEMPLTERKLNDFGGEEAHILTVPELPKHSHPVNDPQHKHGGLPTDEGQVGQEGSPRSITSWFKGSKDTDLASTNITIGSTGGDQPHNNMPPYWALHYIIKVSPTPAGHAH